MEPMTMMLLAGGLQTALGAGQKFGAARMRRKAQQEFSPYQIPASARASLDKASSIATMRGLPGEDLARSRAMSSASRGVEAAQRTAESPADVLSVLGRVYGDSYMGFEQNLAMQGEQAYDRRQQGVMSALNQFAGYETERWQYNELYPYMQMMGAAGDMDAAGGSNISGGINMGMQTMGAQADINQQNKMFDQWHNWQMGANPGQQFGRSRAQENQLRSLYQPAPNPTINIPRTDYQW
jgi:hypothetical protein